MDASDNDEEDDFDNETFIQVSGSLKTDLLAWENDTSFLSRENHFTLSGHCFTNVISAMEPFDEHNAFYFLTNEAKSAVRIFVNSFLVGSTPPSLVTLPLNSLFFETDACKFLESTPDPGFIFEVGVVKELDAFIGDFSDEVCGDAEEAYETESLTYLVFSLS